MEQNAQNDLLIRIDQKLDDALERLGTLEKVIYLGNGQPSLKDRVKALEERSMDCKECPYEAARNKIFWWGVAAMGTGLVAVLWVPAKILFNTILTHLGLPTP